MVMVESRQDAGSGRKRESLRERVVTVGTDLSIGQYALVTLVAALGVSGEWILDGASSCAHWISGALDVELSTAREWLRVGKALMDLPFIDAAYDEGCISYSKVRLLTRVATPENEIDLLEVSDGVPAGRLGVVLATWLNGQERSEAIDARHRRARSVSWQTDPSGMIVGSFRLPPAEGKRLTEAINAEVVRGDGATFDDGTPIPWGVLERIAPASFVRALIHDSEGRPINASGRHRHPTVRQKRVVLERDRCCIDCGASEFLQFDHQPDFETSRRTVIDELRIRCRSCHRARHDREGRGGRPSNLDGRLGVGP